MYMHTRLHDQCQHAVSGPKDWRWKIEDGKIEDGCFFFLLTCLQSVRCRRDGRIGRNSRNAAKSAETAETRPWPKQPRPFHWPMINAPKLGQKPSDCKDSMVAQARFFSSPGQTTITRSRGRDLHSTFGDATSAIATPRRSLSLTPGPALQIAKNQTRAQRTLETPKSAGGPWQPT